MEKIRKSRQRLLLYFKRNVKQVVCIVIHVNIARKWLELKYTPIIIVGVWAVCCCDPSMTTATLYKSAVHAKSLLVASFWCIHSWTRSVIPRICLLVDCLGNNSFWKINILSWNNQVHLFVNFTDNLRSTLHYWYVVYILKDGKNKCSTYLHS